MVLPVASRHVNRCGINRHSSGDNPCGMAAGRLRMNGSKNGDAVVQSRDCLGSFSVVTEKRFEDENGVREINIHMISLQGPMSLELERRSSPGQALEKCLARQALGEAPAFRSDVGERVPFWGAFRLGGKLVNGGIE